MKRIILLTFLLVAVTGITAPAAQSSRAGDPPRLIIESMTGEDSFMFYCAPCHGVTGRGDGPVVPVLKTVPRDLTTLAKSNAGTFPRSAVIAFVTGTSRAVAAHGGTDMPVWGPIFRALDPSDARVKVRIENIVRFIESIQAP
jgi:hypothetical protein